MSFYKKILLFVFFFNFNFFVYAQNGLSVLDSFSLEASRSQTEKKLGFNSNIINNQFYSTEYNHGGLYTHSLKGKFLTSYIPQDNKSRYNLTGDLLGDSNFLFCLNFYHRIIHFNLIRNKITKSKKINFKYVDENYTPLSSIRDQFLISDSNNHLFYFPLHCSPSKNNKNKYMIGQMNFITKEFKAFYKSQNNKYQIYDDVTPIRFAIDNNKDIAYILEEQSDSIVVYDLKTLSNIKSYKLETIQRKNNVIDSTINKRYQIEHTQLESTLIHDALLFNDVLYLLISDSTFDSTLPIKNIKSDKKICGLNQSTYHLQAHLMLNKPNYLAAFTNKGLLIQKISLPIKGKLRFVGIHDNYLYFQGFSSVLNDINIYKCSTIPKQ